MEIDAFLRALEAGIGLLPATVIAVALLGGPTAAWLLYRFFIQPRNSRYRAAPVSAVWICSGCRSANELTSSRCYRCRREWHEGHVGIIDPGSGELITVALAAPAPARVTATGPAPVPLDRLVEQHPEIAAGRRGPVPVGPGKTKADRPPRAVGPGRSAPTSRSAPTGRGTPKGSRPRPRAEG
jgi:hypothetical protein